VTDPRVAKMVVKGRCSCCGHKLIQWSPQAIVDAAHAWAETHGAAPKQRDWAEGTPEHPAFTAVYNTFGTWKRFVYATGLPYPKAMSPRTWSRDLIAEAMLDHLLRTGTWPTSASWASAGYGHPSNRTVYDFFSSWNAAKEYAGASVVCRNCGDALGAGQTIWCSARCRRIHRPSPPEAPRGCAGCGGELSSRTIGCAACSDRARKKERRRTARHARETERKAAA